MSKYIVAYDVETTGLNVKTDFVIQLAAAKFDENFEIVDEFVKFVQPSSADWEISEGAFEKHGFTKELIMEKGDSMYNVGKSFLEFVGDCDILSYNGNNFDIKILIKDLRSVGLELSIDRVFFDSLALERKLNSNKLEFVYERYTGKKLEAAHNAIYDVYATIEVFKHQIEKFKVDSLTLDDIMNFDESRIFSLDSIIKKEGDRIMFAQGKYKGIEFMEVAYKDAGYIKWIMTNPEFDITTKNTLRQYYAKNKLKNV